MVKISKTKPRLTSPWKGEEYYVSPLFKNTDFFLPLFKDTDFFLPLFKDTDFFLPLFKGEIKRGLINEISENKPRLTSPWKGEEPPVFLPLFQEYRFLSPPFQGGN